MRLIKITDIHYIVVVLDHFETENNHIWVYDDDYDKALIYQTDEDFFKAGKSAYKITHSTQPLEDMNHGNYTSKVFLDIKELLLPEVEELISGYNVEDMANTLIQKKYPYPNYDDLEHWKDLYKEGFNAHKELVKDKLFTMSFILYLVPKVLEKQSQLNSSDFNDWYNSDFLKMLFPKKEWDVEFDENAKLKLI